MKTENEMDYKKSLTIRKMEHKDIDELLELSIIGYGGEELAATQKQYVRRLELFPEGQYCAEYDGKMIGSVSGLRINFEDYNEEHNFDEISSCGYIDNHNPLGKNLYGINVVVHPDYRQMKIGKHLYEVRRQICKELNLKSIVIGGRLPGFHKYSNKLSPLEYVNEVKRENIYDPVLSFQLRNGFIFRRILPNYLEGDFESQENATLMEWYNPYYIPEKKLNY